jgi:hypothetical protein
MAFLWDEAKRKANLEKHGLDFADAYLVYESPDKLTIISIRPSENRKMDIAMVELHGVILAVVYVERGSGYPCDLVP